jgi:hypothetical protein
MKHFGREALLMLKSTPVKVPAADVAEVVPSFTTTETVEHRVTPQTFRPPIEICLAQTNFRKTETTRIHPHQNLLVTRTQVKKNSLQATNFSYYKAILKPIWTYGIQLRVRLPLPT